MSREMSDEEVDYLVAQALVEDAEREELLMETRRAIARVTDPATRQALWLVLASIHMRRR